MPIFNDMDWHLLLSSIILGWGAAIPIGPINLEMMRRNLTYGTRFGFGLGLGACAADATYVILLNLGALVFLNHATVLRVMGIMGALMLIWFAWGAFHAKSVETRQTGAIYLSVLRCGIEGYLLTLINPYTILFWASVSSTLITLTMAHTSATIIACLGVVVGTFSWICGFNLILHFTRHKFTPKVITGLNITGGVILLGFAIFSFYRAVVI